MQNLDYISGRWPLKWAMPSRLADLHPEIAPCDLQIYPERVVLVGSQGQRCILPREMQAIVEHFVSGRTLRDFILHTRRQHPQLSFQNLFAVLDQLYLHGFINNEAEFAATLDSMRWHYTWPESWVKEDLAVLEFSRAYRLAKPPPFWLGILLSVAFIFLIVKWAPGAWRVTGELGSIFYHGHFWLFLTWLYLSGSLYFTFKTLIRGGLLLLGTGEFPSLRWRLNALGVYLDGFRIPTPDQTGRDVAGVFSVLAGALSLLIVPPVLRVVGVPHFIANELLIVSVAWMLMEWSPFTRSDLTRLLMSLYNFGGETKSESEQRGGSRRDRLVYILHVGSILVWILGLVSYFFYVVPMLWRGVKSGFVSFETGAVLSTVVFSVWWGYYLLSLLQEITQAFQYVGPEKSFRRFWHLHRQVRESLLDSPRGEQSLRELLAQIPVFSKLNPRTLDLVARQSHLQHYPAGEIICRQGARDRDMYFLLAGEVAVYRARPWRRPQKVADFGKGSLFGEVTFFKGGTRTADVVATTGADVLRIGFLSPSNMELNDQQFRYIQDRIWLLQTLASSATFRGTPVDLMEAFVDCGRIVDVPVGRTIIKEGEFGNMFYLIIQGRCTVTQAHEYVRTMGRGEIFGEIAVLFRSIRTATVTTLDECKLLEIPGDQFWNMLASHPTLGVYIEGLGLERLQRDQQVRSPANAK